MKYRFGGKEKKITFGRYPEMPLKDARTARDVARSYLRSGKDPSAERKRLQQEQLLSSQLHFSAIAEEWHTSQKTNWTPRYAKGMTERIENANRAFGALPINDIKPMMVLSCVRSIQQRGSPNMAMRVLQICSSIFAYGIATGRCETNPAEAIRGALNNPVKQRRPAQLTIDQARKVLTRIESTSDVWWSILFASRLTALTAQRPGVVRQAEKSEFEDLDGDMPLWRVPAAKMKLKLEMKADSAFDFLVPLSRQSVDLVKLAMEQSPSERWLLPGQSSWRKAVNENALSNLYRDCGLRGKHVPHGWRASFSTIMNEWTAVEGEDKDRAIIDLMLAHFPDNVESAYNRASYMPRRRQLAQLWADMLLEGARPLESLLPRF